MTEITDLEKAAKTQNNIRIEVEKQRLAKNASPQKASLQEKIREFEAEIEQYCSWKLDV
jgi:dsDNA-specific endonuclease/ATPase MutS2